MIVEVAGRSEPAPGDRAGLPRLRTAGNPIKLSGFPDPPVRPAAPGLGADGERIRNELDG